MCKFITKSISLRMTHCILAPCKWKNAFGTAFDSYPTVLRIRAPCKAPPCFHECKATKIFWFLSLCIDSNGLFPFTTCSKTADTHAHKKNPTNIKRNSMKYTLFVIFVFPHQNQFWKHTFKQLARNVDGEKVIYWQNLNQICLETIFADWKMQ